MRRLPQEHTVTDRLASSCYLLILALPEGMPTVAGVLEFTRMCHTAFNMVPDNILPSAKHPR